MLPWVWEQGGLSIEDIKAVIKPNKISQLLIILIGWHF
jgi:hypothetical protein